MSTLIPQNFLTLSVSLTSFDSSEIQAKYPPALANKLIGINDELSPIIDDNNGRFAIRVDHRYYLTKDKNQATAFVKIDNSADTSTKIIREIKDPNDTHKYPAKKCIALINNQLQKSGVSWAFTINHFTLFCKYYGLKDNQKYCFVMRVYSQPTYTYSIATVDFIVAEILKDPINIIDNLKKATKNKLTPGAKEF